MNKELKNRGLNAPVIAIAGLLLVVLIGSNFVEGNEIYDAPTLSKVLGYALFAFGCVWAWKSTSWLNFIQNDLWLNFWQILGTFAIMAIGLTVLIA